MFRCIHLNNLLHGIQRNIPQKPNAYYTLNWCPLSTNAKSSAAASNQSIWRHFKKIGYLFGVCATCSLLYATYECTVKVPICPNANRNQNINIKNVLSCTALVKNIDETCSGQIPMKKIGAITGVSYKLVRYQPDNPSNDVRILLNDEEIAQRNLFDVNYTLEYIDTLADVLLKLDESYRVQLLSNIIGYYVFLCPECHSSITRRMLSCTTYLHKAGLSRTHTNISNIDNTKC